MPWLTNEVRALHTLKSPHTGLIYGNYIYKIKGKLVTFYKNKEDLDFQIKEVNVMTKLTG